MQYRSNSQAVEMRFGTADTNGREIYGVAAVFYDGTAATEFPLDPGSPSRRKVVERIFPGAFDAVLRDAVNNDTRALYNHNADHLLGRRSAGTLRLASTPKGLTYSVPFDATDPDHQRVAAKMERGDLRGSSFAFTVEDSGQRFRIDGELGVVEIRSVKKLYDVGPVTQPAYPNTDAGIRSVVDQFRSWEDRNPDLAAEHATLLARCRLAQL